MPTPAWLEQFVAERELADRFVADVLDHVAPLADALIGKGARRIGLSGGQGTGKSTLGACLAALFANEHRKHAVLLSLDDFYLPRPDRLALAKTVHPLYSTRGVPGTHDIGLLVRTIDALDGAAGSVELPVFDKSRDDRSDTTRSIRLPVDIVMLEGWCVGATHQGGAELERPVNALERQEDADGRWRRDVNERLRRDYEPVFAHLDALVFLNPPAYESLYRWRAQQEHELLARRGKGMTDTELTRFMQYYERLTRVCLDRLPAEADIVIDLDEDHSIAALRFSDGENPGS